MYDIKNAMLQTELTMIQRHFFLRTNFVRTSFSLAESSRERKKEIFISRSFYLYGSKALRAMTGDELT